jgi:hypothetical protein
MDTATTNIANELKALLSVITDSVAVAERFIPQRQNLKQGQPIDPELRSSIFAIEAACVQLCSLVARPSDALANVSPDSSFSFNTSNIPCLEIFCCVYYYCHMPP